MRVKLRPLNPPGYNAETADNGNEIMNSTNEPPSSSLPVQRFVRPPPFFSKTIEEIESFELSNGDHDSLSLNRSIRHKQLAHGTSLKKTSSPPLMAQRKDLLFQQDLMLPDIANKTVYMGSMFGGGSQYHNPTAIYPSTTTPIYSRSVTKWNYDIPWDYERSRNNPNPDAPHKYDVCTMLGLRVDIEGDASMIPAEFAMIIDDGEDESINPSSRSLPGWGAESSLAAASSTRSLHTSPDKKKKKKKNGSQSTNAADTPSMSLLDTLRANNLASGDAGTSVPSSPAKKRKNSTPKSGKSFGRDLHVRELWRVSGDEQVSSTELLHKSENAWSKQVAKDEQELASKTMLTILNKLTPEKFEALSQKALTIEIGSSETLDIIVKHIFEIAITSSSFASLYAKFCSCLSSKYPEFTVTDPNNALSTKTCNFRSLLLTHCYTLLVGDPDEIQTIQNKSKNKFPANDNHANLLALEEQEFSIRRKQKGNMIFIGELFKHGLLARSIMHLCIDMLLDDGSSPDESDLESLCLLLSTVGSMLDQAPPDEVVASQPPVRKSHSRDTLPTLQTGSTSPYYTAKQPENPIDDFSLDGESYEMVDNESHGAPVPQQPSSKSQLTEETIVARSNASVKPAVATKSALMDAHFSKIEMLSKNRSLPSRTRFMLLDLLELRQRTWIPRLHKTVDPQLLKKRT